MGFCVLREPFQNTSSMDTHLPRLKAFRTRGGSDGLAIPIGLHNLAPTTLHLIRDIDYSRGSSNSNEAGAGLICSFESIGASSGSPQRGAETIRRLGEL